MISTVIWVFRNPLTKVNFVIKYGDHKQNGHKLRCDIDITMSHLDVSQTNPIGNHSFRCTIICRIQNNADLAGDPTVPPQSRHQFSFQRSGIGGLFLFEQCSDRPPDRRFGLCNQRIDGLMCLENLLRAACIQLSRFSQKKEKTPTTRIANFLQNCHLKISSAQACPDLGAYQSTSKHPTMSQLNIDNTRHLKWTAPMFFPYTIIIIIIIITTRGTQRTRTNTYTSSRVYRTESSKGHSMKDMS